MTDRAQAEEVAALRHVAYVAGAFLSGTATKIELRTAHRAWTKSRKALERRAFSPRESVGGGGGLFASEVSLLEPSTSSSTSVDKPAVETPAERSEAAVSPRGAWLTQYAEVWKAAYGGWPSWGILGKALKQPREELGDVELLRRWRNYIARTPAQYASERRFAKTLNEWTSATSPTARVNGDAPRPEESVDEYIARVAR